MAQTDATQRNKATVQASFDAWRAGTGSPFDLLADTATWTIVGNSVASRTYGSKEDFMREVIRPFNARMSVGLKPTTIRGLHADGYAVVIFFDLPSSAFLRRAFVGGAAWYDRRHAAAVAGGGYRDSRSANHRTSLDL